MRNQLNIKQLTIIIAIAGLLLSSCIANKNSFISKGEKVFLKLEHENESKDLKFLSSVMPSRADSARSRGMGFAVPYLFNMTINEAIRIINKDKEKYIAKYKAEVSDDLFYSGNEKDAGINIQTIKLFRLVQSKNSDEDTAMVLKLGIEQSSDGKFMRFFTKDIKFKYSKAKLKTGDHYTDLTVNLSLMAFWFEETPKVAHLNKEIANVNLFFYNIPYNKQVSKNELDCYKSSWFPVVPRTQFNLAEFGTGNIQLTVTVTEYDSFTKRTTISPVNPVDYLKNQSGEVKGIINTKMSGN
jgi:hypothetical protein